MNKHSKNSGFTLVELTITMGIFVFVVFMVISIFMTSVKAERNVAEQTAILDNLALVIEQMAREIRTGTGFPEQQAPASPTSTLVFMNYRGETVSYQKSETYITKTVFGKIMRLTADDIKITALNFYITTNNFYPPRVTIVIRAESPLFKNPVSFQTTVSERLFYYKEP